MALRLVKYKTKIFTLQLHKSEVPNEDRSHYSGNRLKDKLLSYFILKFKLLTTEVLLGLCLDLKTTNDSRKQLEYRTHNFGEFLYKFSADIKPFIQQGNTAK